MFSPLRLWPWTRLWSRCSTWKVVEEMALVVQLEMDERLESDLLILAANLEVSVDRAASMLLSGPLMQFDRDLPETG